MEKFNHYEINIALNGKHLFTTEPKSVTNSSELVRIMNVFEEKFPSEEGFEITVTKWESKGIPVIKEDLKTTIEMQ